MCLRVNRKKKTKKKHCQLNFKQLNDKFACPLFIARGLTLIANQLSTRFCFYSIGFCSRKNSIKERTMKRSIRIASIYQLVFLSLIKFQTFYIRLLSYHSLGKCIKVVYRSSVIHAFFPIGIILTWCDFNLFRPTYLYTVKMPIWSLFRQWKAIFAFWWN